MTMGARAWVASAVGRQTAINWRPGLEFVEFRRADGLLTMTATDGWALHRATVPAGSEQRADGCWRVRPKWELVADGALPRGVDNLIRRVEAQATRWYRAAAESRIAEALASVCQHDDIARRLVLLPTKKGFADARLLARAIAGLGDDWMIGVAAWNEPVVIRSADDTRLALVMGVRMPEGAHCALELSEFIDFVPERETV